MLVFVIRSLRMLCLNQVSLVSNDWFGFRRVCKAKLFNLSICDVRHCMHPTQHVNEIIRRGLLVFIRSSSCKRKKMKKCLGTMFHQILCKRAYTMFVCKIWHWVPLFDSSCSYIVIWPYILYLIYWIEGVNTTFWSFSIC